jgi:hypothetical protein
MQIKLKRNELMKDPPRLEPASPQFLSSRATSPGALPRLRAPSARKRGTARRSRKSRVSKRGRTPLWRLRVFRDCARSPGRRSSCTWPPGPGAALASKPGVAHGTPGPGARAAVAIGGLHPLLRLGHGALGLGFVPGDGSHSQPEPAGRHPSWVTTKWPTASMYRM